MITCIREVRHARGLSLQDVADACDPPTTAQTIGRLETGMRTVSLAWLGRIAAALGVTPADLVTLPARGDLPVVALLGPEGAAAPRRAARIVAPQPASGQVAVRVTAATADFRAGDEIWCDRLAPDAFAKARGRDILLPRAAGRLLFGRLLSVETERLTIRLHIAEARVQAVATPPWIAVAVRLIRAL